MSAGETPRYIQEFNENRTSWKWFERLLNKNNDLADRAIDTGSYAAYQTLLMLEILKELQHLNDKNRP